MGEDGRNPRLVDDSAVEAVQGIQLEQPFPLIGQKQLHAAVFLLPVSSPRLQRGLQFVQRWNCVFQTGHVSRLDGHVRFKSSEICQGATAVKCFLPFHQSQLCEG